MSRLSEFPMSISGLWVGLRGSGQRSKPEIGAHSIKAA